MLDKAMEERKKLVARLTTVESSLKDLKAAIPADTDGEEAAGKEEGARGRSTPPRNQTVALSKERLAKAEEKKVKLTEQIARCDEAKVGIEPLLAALRAQTEAVNSAGAQLTAAAEKFSEFADDL